MLAVYRPQMNDMKTTSQYSNIVSIIDPRHPLYGRTFPLIEVVNCRRAQSTCVIDFENGLIRRVPLKVTDKYPASLEIPTVPISLESLVNMSNIFFRSQDVAE